MPRKIKPFLIGATALCVSASATVGAFAVPLRDAPEIVTTAKPVRVVIKPAPQKPAKKRTIVKISARKSTPKPVAATGLKGVVIDEPNLEEGTISVVTDTNEFATIAIGMGTRVTCGASLAALTNVHTGYVVRCQGNWDQDGFQYRATRVFLGDVVKDTDVVARVNAACENIARARKGGGFGQSLVAMIPPSSQPRAVVVGEIAKPAPAQTAPASVPATGVPAPQNAPANPATPATAPVQQAPTVPAQPAPAVPTPQAPIQ